MKMKFWKTTPRRKYLFKQKMIRFLLNKSLKKIDEKNLKKSGDE